MVRAKTRVLCVDDDIAMLELMKHFLEKNPDMVVEVIESPQKALEKLEAEKFDAVVVDYALEGTDGIQILKTLRGKGDSIPFILLTGKSREEVAIEALNNGADFYLQKSTDAAAQFTVLSNMIRQAVQQRTAEQLLQETYQRLEAIIHASPIPIYAIDVDGRVTLWNEATERVFGWKADEVIGRPLPIIQAEAQEQFRSLRELVAKGKAFSGLEIRRLRKDGSYVDLLLSAAPLRNESGEFIGIMAAALDMTELKGMDIQLKRLNRIYAMLSQTNAAILRIKDREEMFNEVCRIAVEHGAFKMAWIGIVDRETKVVKAVASSGMTKEFLSTFRITIDDEPTGRGPTGKAIREGKLVISNDIANDPNMLLWRDTAQKLGVASSASIPIRTGGKVIGSFSIYASEPDFFQEEEKALLEEIASGITYALDGMKAEETRRKVQHAHRREAEVTKKVFDTAGAVIVVMDRKGRIVRLNKEVERVTGFSSEEILGKSIWETVIPPEIQDDVKKVFADLRAGNFPSKHENEWLTKEGSRRLISWSNTALVNADGAVEFVIATGIDVTERRTAQEALEKNEARLRLITENQLDMITQLDSEAKYVYASASHKQAVGYDPEYLIGKSILEFIHPDDLEGTIEAIARAVSTTAFIGGKQLRFRRADGSYIWVEAVGKGVFDDKGKLIGGVFGTRDIDERRLAEERLRRRTEEAEAAKARAQIYLDFISHDIINIITPMTSYSQLMLSNEKNPPDTKKHAEKIDLQLRRLSSFVKNLRRLSRVEIGWAKGVEIANLEDLLSRAEDDVRTRNPRKHVIVNYSLPKGPLLLPGKGLVDEIVYEVFNNAAQYSTSDEVIVDVAVKEQAFEGGEPSWRIEIADHGPGIPDEKKMLLVNEPMEGAAAMTRGVATTLVFLGLMVERLGGTMRIEDRVKGDYRQGAKVVLRLPRASAGP